MKVLHVIPSISPIRGGPSQVILETVQALCQQGIEAEIATTNDNGPDSLQVPLAQRVDYPLNSGGSVPVWFFPRFSSPNRLLREFAFSRSFTTWLWKKISDYDLLHIYGIFSYTSTLTMATARRKQVPYIIRPLGQLCEWSLQQSAHRKQIYFKLFEQANLNHSQAIHYTSQKEQEETALLKLTAPSFVLPNGLMLHNPIPDARLRLRQTLKLPVDEPIILFLSRLHPKKGLNSLIPALGKLAQHHRFTFVLAGNGSADYEVEIENLLADHGLRDRTHRSGLVTGELKALLLQGADLFTLTSYSENFGVAVLEAMAAGLPIVTTPGVALASLVAEHQLGKVPLLNIDAIAIAIHECLSNLEQSRAMGERARQLIAERYTWQPIAVNLIQTYAGIL